MSDKGEARGRGSTRSAKAGFRCVSVGRRLAFMDGYRFACQSSGSDKRHPAACSLMRIGRGSPHHERMCLKLGQE